VGREGADEVNDRPNPSSRELWREHQAERGLLGRYALWAAGIAIVGAVGVGVVWSMTAPLRMASGVVNQTLDARNAIATYERFHDRWRNYEARLGQIGSHTALLAVETAPDERRRLSIEIAAMRQSCRETAAGYNAEATMTNRAIFQGRTAPERLDMARCDR
jgi:hypothetical protein